MSDYRIVRALVTIVRQPLDSGLVELGQGSSVTSGSVDPTASLIEWVSFWSPRKPPGLKTSRGRMLWLDSSQHGASCSGASGLIRSDQRGSGTGVSTGTP